MPREAAGTVAPLLVGPGNALLVCGAPWRWVRDAASSLGVPFVEHGRKRLIPAAALLDALSRSKATDTPANDADPADAVRAMLALRRGSR